MSYIWNKFNIKTFPSETLVFTNGNYQADLSTVAEQKFITKKYDLPLHYIYVGEIEGENTLNINLMTQNQPVFLSVDVKNKKPAFLNIFIKNTGKNSDIRGHIMCENSSDLVVKIVAEHDAPETGILLQTKIIGHKESFTKCSGVAIINPNCVNARSDIRFSGFTTDTKAKIQFIPAQRILSTPEYAEHGANLFHINKEAENYLRGAGLSGAEVKDAMIEAFIKDFTMF